MRRIPVMYWVAVLFTLLFCAGIPVRSQTLLSVNGEVTDSSGAAIANATVHLTNPATNFDRSIVTDQTGGYTFSGVPAGTYRLVVDAQGFEEYVQSEVRLTTNAPVTLNVKLTIKQVQQSVTVREQTGVECLSPQSHFLPDVGPGLRAIRRGPSGNYYVLTNPGSAVAIYSSDGKRVGQVPSASAAKSSPDSLITSGLSLQVGSDGRVYVADFAASAIKIYSPDGRLEKKVRVPAPVSVEPLPGGEIAVASRGSNHFVDVYDGMKGGIYQSFGEVGKDESATCDTSTLLCTVHVSKEANANVNVNENFDWFYGDSQGNVFVNLANSPDPTIRKYDSYGYLIYESTFPISRILSGKDTGSWNLVPVVTVPGMGTVTSSQDATQPCSTTPTISSGSASTTTTDSSCVGNTSMNGNNSMGGGMGHGMEGMHGMDHEGGGEMGGPDTHGGMRGGRMQGGSARFGLRLTQRAGTSNSKPTIDAVSVDPEDQNIWAAIDGNLIRFDADGRLVGYYCLSSTDQPPIRPTTILIESDRILIGTDPFGILQYSRPDKPAPAAP